MSRRAQQMVSRLVKHFGGGQTGTVRRRHSLVSEVAATSAAALLAINATAALGLSTVVFKSTDGSLHGTLPKGMTFTLPSDATVYTTSAAAEASSNLVTVTFAPALSAEATLDDAVTLAVDYVDHPFSFMRSSSRREDVGEQIGGAPRRINLATGATVPLVGDIWSDTDGEYRINGVDHINPSSVQAGHILILGEAA